MTSTPPPRPACPQCKEQRPSSDYLDAEGRLRQLCAKCRGDRTDTNPGTPDARKSSGHWKFDLKKK